MARLARPPATLAALLLAIPAVLVIAQGHDVVLPYIPPPQSVSKLEDPVARLTRRIAAGDTTLEWSNTGGQLASLLRALRIPISSQLLVFSKTSLQFEYITPRTPRAIYFNDNVYVGFVPEGGVLEVSSVDPTVGAVFFTVGQRAGARPTLVTNVRCLQCHLVPATLGVAGHLVRSGFVQPDGYLEAGAPTFMTDQRSPFENRWGGWFVSGSLTRDQHMGNALITSGQRASSFDRGPGTRITSVGTLFRSDLYLSPHSDVVAHMVLDHQTRMHNLIAKLHHDAEPALTPSTPDDSLEAPARVPDDIEALVRYMLFVDEAPLGGPVTGSTTYASDFERLGPVDGRGRSLRQFDLRTRLFKYPCSYLIYSDAFLALPAPIKARLYSRLADILNGRDSTLDLRLSQSDRTAVDEILRATHQEYRAAGGG
jgi:hypothetical protein